MPDNNQIPQTFPEDTIIPPIPSGMVQDTSFPNPIQTITDIPPQEVNTPPGLPPIIPSGKPPKKFGGKKFIATILGILILVGGIATGVVLVKQQQDIREKAAYCPVINGCVADHDVRECNDKGEMCTFYVGEPGYEVTSCTSGANNAGCPSGYYCMHYNTCYACVQNSTCYWKEEDNCVVDESCGGSPPTSTPTPRTTPTPTPRATPTPTPRSTPTPPYRGCGEACNDYIHCIPSLNCPGGPGGGHCVNGLCPNDPDCVCAGTPTPTPRATPTPTPRSTPTPTPGIDAICSAVKAYDINWNLLSGAQLSALSAGSVVRFTISGTPADQIDKARFTINGVLGPEITTKKPGTNEYYVEYTIPAGVYSFTVTAQIHHLTLGWF